MNSRDTRKSLSRWRSGRRIVLGSLILAGSVATSAAVLCRFATHPAGAHRTFERAYTYSGVGVVIDQKRGPRGELGPVVVRRVIAGSPADGAVSPGARLIEIDGQRPDSVEGWASAIRGAPGSSLEVTVAYPCGGDQRVQLVRDIVRVRY